MMTESRAVCVFSFSFTCISDQASGPGERLVLVPGGLRKCRCLVWKIIDHTYGVGFLCARQKWWIKLCLVIGSFFLMEPTDVSHFKNVCTHQDCIE